MMQPFYWEGKMLDNYNYGIFLRHWGGVRVNTLRFGEHSELYHVYIQLRVVWVILSALVQCINIIHQFQWF